MTGILTEPTDAATAAGRPVDNSVNDPHTASTALAGNRILMGMAGKQDKATAKAEARQRRVERRERWGQYLEAFQTQRREDPLLLPMMLASVLGLAAIGFVVGLFFHFQWYLLVLGLLFGVLLALIIFGRRAQSSVYKKADGTPGAAGWALDNMRGRWTVAQGVAGTGQFDVVHRVLGRPGVILVGEGAPHRVKSLLAQEKKRVARVVGTTPIYDIVVGNDEGQIPLRRLQQHVMRLPRNISQGEVDSIEDRLAALASRGQGAALPKGPMPQGAKIRNVQRAIRRR
jgi:hypothetical protein